MVLGMLMKIIREKRDNKRRERERRVFVNALNARKLVINGREYLIRDIKAVGENAIVVEDIYGNIIQIPVSDLGKVNTQLELEKFKSQLPKQPVAVEVVEG